MKRTRTETLLRRFRERIGSGSDGPRAETDGGELLERAGGESLERRYDPDLDALEGVYGDAEAAAIGDRHVRDLFDLDGGAVTDLVAEYRTAGISAPSFAASRRVISDALVDAAFDRLEEELDADAHDALAETRTDLLEGLRTANGVFAAGVDAYERGPNESTEEQAAQTVDSEGSADAAGRQSERSGLDYHEVLHRIGTPLFVLNPEGEILTWNAQLEQLTGVPEDEAMAMEMASMAFYPDGRRGKTLADKVVDAPERTDEEYDVPRVEDASFTLYRDTSVMQDQHGEDVHISFSAAPIYDDDGELLGVVEMVQDRTSDVLRHKHTASLVTELEDTMRAIQSGDLDARATFDNAEGHVDESLLNVVGELNEMASTLERLITRVDGNTTDLAAATDESAAAATQIEDVVAEQNQILGRAAEDIQDVSATMEEIAATSNQVSTAADRANEAVDEGASASEEAQAVTDDLTDTSQELVDSVTGLEDRMDEVSEVIEVIADVAEQTNMLALNANIEAARAGESGSGFAVVADEVKALATETSEYADRISRTVTEIQNQATDTVDTVETSNRQIQRAEDEIAQALDALDDIAEAVEETASGIEEVADANDSQAEAIEGVTTTIEDARSHAEDAEAAARRIVETTDSQTESVAKLVDSVEQLHGDASAQ